MSGDIETACDVPGCASFNSGYLVVQADAFNETHAGVTLVPTSTLVDAPLFRLTVEPSPANGLRALSQIMIDKVTTVRRARIAKTIGHVEDDTLLRVSRALALWVGIAAWRA